MSGLNIYKAIALGFMASTMAGSGIYGDDTSRSANTRLPTDHEANIKNAAIKRYTKAVKKGFLGTFEEYQAAKNGN